MNWYFNQNCELEIKDLPENQSGLHTIEILVKDGNVWATAVDRTITFTMRVEDGLYKYYVIYDSNESPEINLNQLGDPIENIFSICNLRKCAFAHEKQAIVEFLSVYNKKNCNKKSEQQFTRDMLLISLFVLEHLICEEKYNEAQRIVNQLGFCGNLCDNQTLKHCNCNE